MNAFDYTTLPPTLVGFVMLLLASVGSIISWLTEYWPFFAALPPWAKALVSAALSLLFGGLLTWLTSVAAPGTVDKLNGFYVIILQFLLTFGSNFVFHVVYHGFVQPTAAWYKNKVRVPLGHQG